MGKIEKYRHLVKQILEKYASYKFSSAEIEVMPVFDLERDRYQVVSAGWKDERRIYGCSVHIDIKDGKIWIQHDGTEIGFADELVNLGVPREDILLAYHSPFMRQFDGFAVS
ncbi:XisI protein [Nostoc calcicola FACHB-389]|nr:XisI protein [Nostoc calcicola FACHB-3891]OKH33525.1 XisI protein [Nostoc calcicola FACHB-389]